MMFFSLGQTAGEGERFTPGCSTWDKWKYLEVKVLGKWKYLG